MVGKMQQTRILYGATQAAADAADALPAEAWHHTRPSNRVAYLSLKFPVEFQGQDTGEGSAADE